MNRIAGISRYGFDKLLEALNEIENMNKKVIQSFKNAKTEKEAKQKLNEIFHQTEVRLNEIVDSFDKEVQQENKTKDPSFDEFIESIKSVLEENLEEDEDDCECDQYFKQETEDLTYMFSEVIQYLTEREIAISLEGDIEIVRLPNNGLAYKDGESIIVTPELLNTEFRIVPKKKESQLVAVPMHIALQAFEDGETIVLEYKDLLRNPDEMISVEIDPNVSELHRPFIHFDSVLNGVYYIKKSK